VEKLNLEMQQWLAKTAGSYHERTVAYNAAQDILRSQFPEETQVDDETTNTNMPIKSMIKEPLSRPEPTPSPEPLPEPIPSPVSESTSVVERRSRQMLTFDEYKALVCRLAKAKGRRPASRSNIEAAYERKQKALSMEEDVDCAIGAFIEGMQESIEQLNEASRAEAEYMAELMKVKLNELNEALDEQQMDVYPVLKISDVWMDKHEMSLYAKVHWKPERAGGRVAITTEPWDNVKSCKALTEYLRREEKNTRSKWYKLFK
jgi:HPt (histidine-containing phosphotransfer) domain-containing protein